MANLFCVTKSERSRLRKLPLLPRFGVTVDVAGRQFTFKHAPLLETLLNARERGLTVKNLLKVASEQLAEIHFPAVAKRAVAVVKSTDEKTAQKKPAAKAAAKKKPAPAAAAPVAGV